MTKLLKQVLSYALIFCFIFNMVVVADEKEDIKREIDNWKRRYKQDLSKLKSKLQQLKEKQAHQTKTLPHQFDRLLDKYLKEGSEPVTWLNILSPKNRIKFYGFLRLDMNYDSHRTNNGDAAFFVNNHNSSTSDQDEELNIHIRNTRLGIKLDGPKLSYLGNPRVSGKLEVDFFGGGSESRARIRMRHAYLQLNWDEPNIYLRAGQGADIIAPISPDTVEWAVPGRNRGNPGERRPGLAVGYTSPSLGQICGQDITMSLEGGFFRNEPTGGQDVDGDGNNDGEDSGAPMLQYRLGFLIPTIWRKTPVTFGFWGAHGWEESQSRIGINGEDDFQTTMFGLDAKIPLFGDLITLSGEFWWGNNLNDLLAGVGQGIDTFHGKEIESIGGWISTKIKPNDCFSMSFGYMWDNPQDEDVEDFGATGRRFNSTAFINNVWNLGSGVSFGYEYQYMLTSYNRTDGSNYNNRGIVFIAYKF